MPLGGRDRRAEGTYRRLGVEVEVWNRPSWVVGVNRGRVTPALVVVVSWLVPRVAAGVVLSAVAAGIVRGGG